MLLLFTYCTNFSQSGRDDDDDDDSDDSHDAALILLLETGDSDLEGEAGAAAASMLATMSPSSPGGGAARRHQQQGNSNSSGSSSSKKKRPTEVPHDYQNEAAGVLGRSVEILFNNPGGDGTQDFYPGVIRAFKVELVDSSDAETDNAVTVEQLPQGLVSIQHFIKFEDGDEGWFDLEEEEDAGGIRWKDNNNNKNENSDGAGSSSAAKRIRAEQEKESTQPKKKVNNSNVDINNKRSSTKKKDQIAEIRNVCLPPRRNSAPDVRQLAVPQRKQQQSVPFILQQQQPMILFPSMQTGTDPQDNNNNMMVPAAAPVPFLFYPGNNNSNNNAFMWNQIAASGRMLHNYNNFHHLQSPCFVGGGGRTNGNAFPLYQQQHHLQKQQQQQHPGNSSNASQQKQQQVQADDAANPKECSCIPLDPVPIPFKFPGDMEKYKSAPVPEIATLINYSARPSTKCESMFRCTMCGDDYPFGSGKEETNGSIINNKKVHMIPNQNVNICTSCEAKVWVVTDSRLLIKHCRGCKNFRPWAAFGPEGGANQCAACRHQHDVSKQEGKDAPKREQQQQQKAALVLPTTK